MNQSILNFPRQAVRHGSSLSTFHILVAHIIIIAAVFLSYFPAYHNDFVSWDDQYYITQNIYIAQPTISHLTSLLTKAISLNYHPMTMVSLWLNSFFYGIDSATSFIVTNIIIHALSSVALLQCVLLLSKNNLWLSVFVSLIFAIHPMHVESVAWVSERKDVLYVLFFFLAMYQYIRYVDIGRRRYYILSLLMFVFSCLSKGMAVSLVPVLFLIDYYRDKPILSLKSILNKLPFIGIGITFGLIAVSIQSGGDFFGLISNTSLENALSNENNFSLWERWKYAGYSLTHYISSFFYWNNISAFHPYRLDISWTYSVLPVIIIAALVYSYRYSKNTFFGLGFFVATIILILPFVQLGSAVMADRYTYLPYAGIAFAAGSYLQYIFKSKQKVLYLLTTLVSLICISATNKEVRVWKDHTTLFENVVTKYPDDARARTILATGYWTEGKIKKAIDEQEYAINNLGLYTSEGFENLATFYGDLGEKEKALAFYNHSISLDSNNLIARYHRGLLLIDIKPEKAIEDFNICEKYGDEYVVPLIYSPRGNCYGRLQQYDEAVSDFTKAIELGQDVIISYKDRATTYQLMGQNELAEKDLEMVKKLESK